ADAMYRSAQVAVREEAGTSPFRATALALLGLATLIRGADGPAAPPFAAPADVGLRIGGRPAASLALAERSLIATSRGDGAAADDLAARARAAGPAARPGAHLPAGP